MRALRTALLAITFAAVLSAPASWAQLAPNEPKFAALNDCALENGAVIKDCRLGYITRGTLNANKSNVILMPTFAGGRSQHLLAYVGPGKLVDSDKYFVIIVDAFGNGVSSSPSNSVAQPGAAFPAVSIGDMTRMQKRLLAETFGLTEVHAIMGQSMGAMQTLEWAAREPQFAKKFVAIAGSPRLAPYDMVFWQTHIRLLELVLQCNCQTPMQAMAGMRFLMDAEKNLNTPPSLLDKTMSSIDANKVDPKLIHDRLLQYRAMMGLDVSRHHDGDMGKAAKSVGSRLLVLVGSKDVIVTPAPVLEYAKLGGAKAIQFPACGHDVPRCESDVIFPTVRDFLER